MEQKRTVAETNAILTEATEHGVVTTEGCRRRAVAPAVLQRRAKAGLLVRIVPGAYKVAATQGGFAHEATTELVAARGEALCLWSANHALGVERARPQRFHIAVGQNGSRVKTRTRHPHRIRRALEPDETTRIHGVPVTTAARTLRDFAATLGARDWQAYIDRWTEEALMQRRMTFPDLERQHERERAPQVRRRLRRLIDHHMGRGTEDLKSEGERWLRNFLEERGIPLPEFNVRVPETHHDADAFWRDVPLALEFDSFNYHATRAKRTRDARRQRRSQAEGVPIWPITADDLRTPTLRLELEQDLVRALDPLIRREPQSTPGDLA